MAKPLSHRLSGEDAAFLYFEKPSAPLHVGSLGIYEGTLDLDQVIRHLDKRIQLVPRYRQRVEFVPLNLGHPVWLDDPQFDLRRHLRRVRPRGPVTDARLAQIAAEIFAPAMPRDRPLWDATIIEGLTGNRCALLARAHHCMVDGIAGVELLEAALDFTPVPRRVRLDNARRAARPRPTATELVSEALWERLAAQLRGLSDLEMTLVEPRRRASTLATIARGFGEAIPYFTRPAPAFPFNTRVQPRRAIAWTAMPFSEVRAIRKAFGATINDVVLAIVCGGLSRYVGGRNNLPGLEIRMLIPVNVRTHDDEGTLGNRVSFMLTELPLDVRDPVLRLQAVRERIGRLKRAQQPEAVDLLAGLLGRLPPSLLSPAVGAVPLTPNTLSNVLCTNVPGPMVPLYCVGHRMLEHYVLAPVAWDMGMSIGVMSYDQRLFYCVITNAQALPDPGRFVRYLERSFRELRRAAGLSAAEATGSTETASASDRPAA